MSGYLSTENNPECQFKLTAVSVNITCSVEFFGNWAPIMVWKIGESQDLEIKQYSSDTGLVLSNLSLPLNSSNIDPACQLNIVTRFSEFGRPKEASATNVPGYNHTNSPSSKFQASATCMFFWSVAFVQKLERIARLIPTFFIVSLWLQTENTLHSVLGRSQCDRLRAIGALEMQYYVM